MTRDLAWLMVCMTPEYRSHSSTHPARSTRKPRDGLLCTRWRRKKGLVIWHLNATWDSSGRQGPSVSTFHTKSCVAQWARWQVWYTGTLLTVHSLKKHFTHYLPTTSRKQVESTQILYVPMMNTWKNNVSCLQSMSRDDLTTIKKWIPRFSLTAPRPDLGYINWSGQQATLVRGTPWKRLLVKGVRQAYNVNSKKNWKWLITISLTN